MEKESILQAHALREKGYSYGQIACEMMISKSQANYLCKLNADDVNAKETSHIKYEEKVCQLAQKCNNINQICKILGHKPTTAYYQQIQKIINQYEIDTSHFVSQVNPHDKKPKTQIEDVLENKVPIQTTKLKTLLIKNGLKEHKCEHCGRTEWEGRPIPIQLHHINGNNKDNHLDNLQILCPNCHALTDNFCGKNIKRGTNRCEICGKEISRKAKYCHSCFNSLRSKQRGSSHSPQTKEELLEVLKSTGSFTGGAKKYGVAVKTLKSYCAQYGIPTHSIEMRTYLRNHYKENLKWTFSKGNEKSLREYQKEHFKKIALLKVDSDEVDKIYNSVQEVETDGFHPKDVYNVCQGKAKTHKKRKFAYA